MKPVRKIGKLLVRTGAIKVFGAYLVVLLAGGVLLSFIEPQVHGIIEGFYFCFIASTTVGFGDIVPVTALGRIITIIVTMVGVMAVAVVPGVVVAYCTDYLKIREKETIASFLEKLERLPELSKEELTELSEKVKEFNKNK